MKRTLFTIGLCFLLCLTAEAKTIEDVETSTLTFSSESISYNFDYSYYYGGGPWKTKAIILNSRYYTKTGFSEDSLHRCRICGEEGYYTLPTSYTLPGDLVTLSNSSGSNQRGPEIFIIGATALDRAGHFTTYHNSTDSYYGPSGYYAKSGATAIVHTIGVNTTQCVGTHLTGCTYATLQWNITHYTEGKSVTCYYEDDVEYRNSTRHTYELTDFTKGSQYSTVIFKGCRTNDVTIPNTSFDLQINGGTYIGRPAINSSNATVITGTITDNGGNSVFLVGPDSEQQVTTSDNKTITTVKLSNPPVIIDWADFPG